MSPWSTEGDGPAGDPLPRGRIDVAICGAGVMGAMLAERLAGAGLSVAIVDRRRPAAGSTAASTALVLWEADVPLADLSARIGEAEAARRWRAVRRAVDDLARRIDGEDFEADRIDRPSVYIVGDLLDAEGLKREAALRQEKGFPSVYLAPEETAARFGIAPVACIVSGESYEIDPVKLTLTLLSRATAMGATASFPVDVLALQHEPDGIALETTAGVLRADHAILATGYERARLYLPPAFDLHASYAIATTPGTAPLWRENAMIWQASESYIYARADAAGRIIAGGGDEPFSDARHRDLLIPEKSAQIASELGKLVGTRIVPHERWAAMFGSSPDGLPAIGRAANSERLWLASGFGGNGISFAALASEIIAAELTGAGHADADAFRPYRFG